LFLREQSFRTLKEHSIERNAVVESWDGLDHPRATARGQALFLDHMQRQYPDFSSVFEQVPGPSVKVSELPPHNVVVNVVR